jgi:hypothetical protein
MGEREKGRKGKGRMGEGGKGRITTKLLNISTNYKYVKPGLYKVTVPRAGN